MAQVDEAFYAGAVGCVRQHFHITDFNLLQIQMTGALLD